MFAFILQHWFTIGWLVAVAIAIPFAWHWLAQYKIAASIEARIEAAGGSLWASAMLHLEGAKSAILMAIASAFATAKDWAGSTFHTLFGLSPTDLDPFKDSTILHAFFADGVALKVIAGVSFFAAILSIHGKMTAAKMVPASPAAS